LSKNIIAIGGGGFGRSPGRGIIEKYILEQSQSMRPKICFIPTATGDDDAYKVNFYSTFTKLNCVPVHLDLFKRTPDLKTLISAQDIIFVGGGNTMSMLGVWQQWGLDKILRQAYEEGTVMSGVSAGAICWFKQGVTDSWENSLNLMDCLGFVDGACCPHYDEELERKPSLHKLILNKSINSCHAIEGGCALHLVDGIPFKSIAFAKRKKSYLVELKKNKVKETPHRREKI
jgi:aminopeptidase N